MNTSRINRIRNGYVILTMVCWLLKSFHVPNFNLQYVAWIPQILFIYCQRDIRFALSLVKYLPLFYVSKYCQLKKNLSQKLFDVYIYIIEYLRYLHFTVSCLTFNILNTAEYNVGRLSSNESWQNIWQKNTVFFFRFKNSVQQPGSSCQHWKVIKKMRALSANLFLPLSIANCAIFFPTESWPMTPTRDAAGLITQKKNQKNV